MELKFNLNKEISLTSRKLNLTTFDINSLDQNQSLSSLTN